MYSERFSLCGASSLFCTSFIPSCLFSKSGTQISACSKACLCGKQACTGEFTITPFKMHQCFCKTPGKFCVKRRQQKGDGGVLLMAALLSLPCGWRKSALSRQFHRHLAVGGFTQGIACHAADWSINNPPKLATVWNNSDRDIMHSTPLLQLLEIPTPPSPRLTTYF